MSHSLRWILRLRSLSVAASKPMIMLRAVADGVIARSEYGVVILDLDGDGDERTGWDILYLHVATRDRITIGSHVQTGDPIGHPSCEGGTSTGTHIHIARKYNGEWVPADGPLAFNLEGWLAGRGNQAYAGTLTKHGQCDHGVSLLQCSKSGHFNWKPPIRLVIQERW